MSYWDTSALAKLYVSEPDSAVFEAHAAATSRREWLREVRRKMLREAGGDFKKLGDRYRAVQSQHPEKTFDPHDIIIRAVKERRR